MAKGAGLSARLTSLFRYFFSVNFPAALGLILKYQSPALICYL